MSSSKSIRDNSARVVLFFRKKRDAANYSIEGSFKSMLSAFPRDSSVTPAVYTISHFSNGLLPRIKAALEARRNAGDVNHVTGDIHFIVFGLPGNNTLLTVHDCGFMRQANPYKRKLLKWLWLDLPVWHCRYVTAVSEATRQDIIRLTGCRPDKVLVIPTIIDGIYRKSLRSFNAGKPRLLHIGLAPNKNFERHVAAIEGLPCTLHIVGKLRQEHRDLLASHEIEYENGCNLSKKEMLEAYINCDIVLFASTFEGFGMPIIEGQSVGRPVVTSNISSMPEVAGEAACLVDPFSVQSIRRGIEQVISNEEYRNTLVERGFSNVTRFTPEAVARQYEELYLKVLQTPP